jgi:uncharacterized protein YabE (DUF348 family)
VRAGAKKLPRTMRRSPRKPILIASAVVVALVVGVAGTFVAMTKTVTIRVDGTPHRVTTLSGTVDGALQSAGITVRPHDSLAPAGNTDISGGSQIALHRGRTFTATIDGQQRTVWTTAPTVGAALKDLGKAPSNFKLSDSVATAIPLSGIAVTANTLHSVTLTFQSARTRDGGPLAARSAAWAVTSGAARAIDATDTTATTPQKTGSHYRTAAKTVDAFLTDQGVDLRADQRVTPDLDTPITNNTAITVATMPTVHVALGGKDPFEVITKADTVGDLLLKQNISLGKHDKVTPAADTSVVDGMDVTVTRVKYHHATKTKKTSQPAKKRVADSSLLKGKTTVTQDGHPGKVKVSYRTKIVNGKKAGKAKEISHKTVTKAIPTITHYGTKVPEPVVTETTTTSSSADSGSSASDSGSSSSTDPSATTSSSSDSSSPESSSDSGSTSHSSDSSSSSTSTSTPAPSTSSSNANWDTVAACESGGDWSINTGNGYYGGLQFDIQTWLANGGGQYASRPDLASKAQQIAIANKVYAARGLQPWPVCGKAHLGVRPW